MYDLAHNDCIDKLLAYDPIDKSYEKNMTRTRLNKEG